MRKKGKCTERRERKMKGLHAGRWREGRKYWCERRKRRKIAKEVTSNLLRTYRCLGHVLSPRV